MNKSHDHSLRRRLLVRLWVPLLLVMVTSALGTYILAQRIGTSVYDRWLTDSAMTLAQQVRVQGDRSTLDISESAIAMFEWDSVDRIFEEVRSRKGETVFRNAMFPPAPHDLVVGEPHFYDTVIDNQPVRVVAVLARHPRDASDAIVVQVAETRNKRKSLITEILSLVIPLQTLIIMLVGISIWYAVTSSLRTVDSIAARLASYRPEGLSAVGDIAEAPTEVRPLLDSINRLIAKLADAQETQRRFIANAAHQLRTPLATLQVQTERALRESDPVKHVEALSHVLTALARSQHVAHQLLTLARSERVGEPGLPMMTVDLAALARAELERWVDKASAREIDLGYEGPESEVFLPGEPHLLQELMGNLVDNAIRYGRAGGVVTLSVSPSPVVLRVDDDGPGIPDEDRDLVIERFYRRPASAGDGCGLGLAIAREIADRHGAQLRIVDNPQGGTRVEVLF
jgi:two-component system sensor histidine kinase TctE